MALTLKDFGSKQIVDALTGDTEAIAKRFKSILLLNEDVIKGAVDLLKDADQSNKWIAEKLDELVEASVLLQKLHEDQKLSTDQINTLYNNIVNLDYTKIEKAVKNHPKKAESSNSTEKKSSEDTSEDSIEDSKTVQERKLQRLKARVDKAAGHYAELTADSLINPLKAFVGWQERKVQGADDLFKLGLAAFLGPGAPIVKILDDAIGFKRLLSIPFKATSKTLDLTHKAIISTGKGLGKALSSGISIFPTIWGWLKSSSSIKRKDAKASAKEKRRQEKQEKSALDKAGHESSWLRKVFGGIGLAVIGGLAFLLPKLLSGVTDFVASQVKSIPGMETFLAWLTGIGGAVGKAGKGLVGWAKGKARSMFKPANKAKKPWWKRAFGKTKEVAGKGWSASKNVFSKSKAFLKIGGKALGVAGGLYGIYDGITSLYEKSTQNVGFFEGGLNSRAADYASSAIGGAGIGATIGSVVPGVGTVVGGAIGGAVGVVGAFLADNADNIAKLFGCGSSDAKNASNVIGNSPYGKRLGQMSNALTDLTMSTEELRKAQRQNAPNSLAARAVGASAAEAMDLNNPTSVTLQDNTAKPVFAATFSPVKGARISSPFGNRYHPILKKNHFHSGIDFAAPTGSPIQTPASGTVSFAGVKGGYGNTVVIDHGNGLSTLYGHMSQIKVQRGQTVNSGSVIGLVGSTGRSTGPHVHFETRQGGKPVNPASVNYNSVVKSGLVSMATDLDSASRSATTKKPAKPKVEKSTATATPTPPTPRTSAPLPTVKNTPPALKAPVRQPAPVKPAPKGRFNVDRLDVNYLPRRPDYSDEPRKQLPDSVMIKTNNASNTPLMLGSNQNQNVALQTPDAASFINLPILNFIG